METEWDWLGPPLDVRPFFPVERAALVELLSGLDSTDWSRATGCPGWSVRDVAAHVLHDQIRRLSAGRDGHPGGVFGAGETVAEFVNRTNEEFVRTARQFSPRLVAGLLAELGGQLDGFWAVRDLTGAAGAGVSWAVPEGRSPAWLDIAREYTEFWVHQQQIRDAVGRPGAAGPALLRPVLDTFLRALPLTLRPAPAAEGALVRVSVPGPAGGLWTAVRGPRRWALTPSGVPAAAEVEIEADTLWRLATRGITPDEARGRTTARGDLALVAAVLEIVSIVR